jgi:hypothetical protein
LPEHSPANHKVSHDHVLSSVELQGRLLLEEVGR